MNKPILLLALADIVGIIGISIFLLGFWKYVENQNWSQVRRVNVFNFSQYMEDLKIEAIIKDLARPGYFKVNIQDFNSQLAKVNFVRGAKIVRTWPMSFDIYLEPQQPLAYYIEGKQKHVLNHFGEIFNSKYPIKENLPIIKAIQTQDTRLNQKHQQFLTQILKNWQQLLIDSKTSWRINQLQLNRSLSIIVNLNNLWQIHLGQYGTINNHKQINDRFKKLIQALPKLNQDFGRFSKLRIDMRYSNSMAISKILVTK